MIHVEKIIIPHSNNCEKAKNTKKIGCLNLEIVDVDMSFPDKYEMNKFRCELEKERGINNITFNSIEIPD